MRNKLIIFLIIFIISTCSSQQYALKWNIDNAKIDSTIDSIFHEMSMTGLAVAIVNEDSIAYEYYNGYKSLPGEHTKGIILENFDLFRIASISKTFVATAIMQLCERGALSLKDDAQKYLSFPLRNPSHPDDEITIEMLLTHTSSINDSRKYWSIDLINPKKDQNYNGCYSPTKPGSQYKYCNLNYNLLGAIIENITGKRFDEVIHKNILSPLGINGGYNCNSLDSTKFVKLYKYNNELGIYIESKEAYKPYNYQLGSNYIIEKYTGLLSPCGGMKITARDLARYMIMHMYGGKTNKTQIINEKSESLIRENYVGKYNYGYSFRQYKNLNPTGTLYGQTGGAYGMKSAMIFDPEKKIGFVILCSGSKSKYIDGFGDIHKPIIKTIYSIING